MERARAQQGTAPRAEPAAAAAPARADGPPERVLALQRSHGNRAARRVLARVPTRIDRYDPIITTVSGPGLGPHGTYDWGVGYQLPFPADADGWLIQELYMEASDAPGGGDHFWETWRVRLGRRIPEPGAFAWDDHYVWGTTPQATQPSSGWRRHVGVIRFYPGPLPREFGPEVPGTDHYNTHTMPSGWTGAGTRHDAYSEWAPGRNGFVGYAGTDEVREGHRVTFRRRP